MLYTEYGDGSQSAAHDPCSEALGSYGGMDRTERRTVKESRNPGW
jgi:hypothetical protein